MARSAVRSSIRGAGRQAYPHQGSSSRLPKTNLLLYLGRPNLEAADVPIGDDTEIGDDTIIRWMFLLPADADIRAATGWISGVGNIFYDAVGDPVAVFASEIAAWADINRYNILFHLVSADTETGRIAIYALDADHATLNKARRVLREDQYDYWAPLGAILHYDAEISPLTELVGGVHAINHAVLGPQYQRLADGSYINVGAQPAVDVLAGGIKGLRTCGDITNLLPGDPSIARAVTLTAQSYTLQVIGAGTVSCSYGTATVGTPLKFTATAGTTIFTPSGATLWMLTATKYPVPYVPPGVTQPVGYGSASGGVWFTNPDGSELWNALDGDSTRGDGVELAANGQFDSATGWSLSGSGVSISGGKLVFVKTDTSYRYCRQSYPFVASRKYLLAFDNLNIISGGYNVVVGGGTTQVIPIVNGQKSLVITALAGNNLFEISRTGSPLALNSLTLDGLSLQRIQPQPFTLATRIPMGVGSADLPIPSYNNQIINCLPSVLPSVSMFERNPSGLGYPSTVKDGTAVVNAGGGVAWPRNAVIQRFTQVNTAGTRFRVGYMIEDTHTTIQWSHPSEDSTTWAAFDGSFNPSTLYRFMLGYNNPYPMWFNKITAWKRQVPVAELEAWA